MPCIALYADNRAYGVCVGFNVSAAGYHATGVIQAACCWGNGYSVPVE